MLLGMPWWIVLLILFICFSGYMSYRAMRAERKLEYQFIEKEGQIYMERMEREKNKRTGSSV